MNAFRTFGSLVAVVMITGCPQSGGKKERATTAAPSGAAVASTAEREWNEGTLPAYVTEGEPKRGGQVTVQLYTEVPSLNYLVDSDAWLQHMMDHNVAQKLVHVDPYDQPNYSPIPELAERWEISDDKLVYTFHLRRNVKFHDGTPFSAKDVVETYDKVLDTTTKAAHLRSYLEELDGYRAVDDFTVEFRFKRPYFLSLDSPFGSIPIQPAHVIEPLTGAQYNEAASNPLNRHPVGTGPFRFVEWVNGERIVFERNPDYWGRAPYIDRLVFRIVKEAAIGLQLAERGELDFVTRIQADQFANMTTPALRQNFNRIKFYSNNYGWIGWNLGRPMFADRRVRRAMTMLVDRPGIINQMRFGLPRPTTCPFYWAGPSCDPSIQPLPFDPTGAVRLLNEAGWRDTNDDGVLDKDGAAFRFVFMIPATSEEAAMMATKMKEDMKKAGVEMDIQKVEWSAFTKRLREHEFDACHLYWINSGPRTDPHQLWHTRSRDGGSNYIGFSNPRVDQIIEEARVLFDDGPRDALYRELHRILHEEQPYTFLLVRPEMQLVSKRLRGVRTTLQFMVPEDWWIADAPAPAAN